MGRGTDTDPEIQQKGRFITGKIHLPTAEEEAREEELEKLRQEALKEAEMRLAREAEAEDFEIRYMKARILAEEYEKDVIDNLIEKEMKIIEGKRQRKEAREEEEEEFFAQHAREKAILEKGGITSFGLNSPGRAALSDSALYADNYSCSIAPVKDELLHEDGKRFVFVVKESGSRFLEKGFADSRENAKVRSQEIIKENIDKKWLELLQRNNEWEERKRERARDEEIVKEEARQRKELQRLESAFRARDEISRMFSDAGLDVEKLRVSRKRDTDKKIAPGGKEFIVSHGIPLFYRTDVSGIEIETIGNVNLVTYARDGYLCAAIFRDGEVYAATVLTGWDTPRYSLHTKEGFDERWGGKRETHMLDATRLADQVDREKVDALVEEKLKKRMGREYKGQGRLGSLFSSKRKVKASALERKKEKLRAEIREEVIAQEEAGIVLEIRESFTQKLKEVLRQSLEAESLAQVN